MIFLDRQCPTCNGEGCERCHGTGMVGGVSDVHVTTPQQEPNSFSERMRTWRLEHGRTFRELSIETGILPSVISEIENGRREATQDERLRLEDCMK